MSIQLALVSWLTGSATVNFINSLVNIFIKPMIDSTDSKIKISSWTIGNYNIGLLVLEIFKLLFLSLIVGLILVFFPIN